jgi:hypothetical protein
MFLPRPPRWILLLAFATPGCSASLGPTGQGAARHPPPAAVRDAFGRVAATITQRCAAEKGARVGAEVRVVIRPSGAITEVAPASGDGCVAEGLRRASIPPFAGPPVDMQYILAATPPAPTPSEDVAPLPAQPPQAQVVKTITAAREEATGCADRRLGVERATAIFGPEGRVTAVQLSSASLAGQAAGPCVLRALQDMRVERYRGAPIAISFPIEVGAPATPLGTPGKLAPEVIQRRIRAAFTDGFGRCYEAGLRRDPALAGRLITAFVIEPDGSVSHVLHEGGDLPDVGVRSCVREIFGKLSFPPPTNSTNGGWVRVTYPIRFSPHAAPKAEREHATDPAAPLETADGQNEAPRKQTQEELAKDKPTK